MDAKTTALLVKIVALFNSPIEGERSNAFHKAQELLGRNGQSMADILNLLTRSGASAAAMSDFIEQMRCREPAPNTPPPPGPPPPTATAAQRQQAAARAELIARYGSAAAVLQPCRREALLHAAVQRDAVLHPPPGERWTRSICGYTPDQPDGPARARAERAIARAYPLPTTIAAALAEHAHWEQRDRELQLVLGSTGGASKLDLTATLRRDLLRRLIRSELPVHGEAEFQLRLQFWIDEQQDALDATTLDEVKRLAETVGKDLRGALVQSGSATTAMFGKWVCDVVVPAFQVPRQQRAGSPPTFDAMLRNAMRSALAEFEAQRRH